MYQNNTWKEEKLEEKVIKQMKTKIKRFDRKITELEENYYKPVRVGNFNNNDNYIKYQIEMKVYNKQ